ncbi:putative pleckstrin domain, PH-like domain superfamily [Helianthus debilis subsp. tardiflorus]
MLNLFNLKRLSWGNNDTDDGKQKVALSATEVESIRSELADLEEREAHLKARLEHVDEILRSARLSGYLQMRTRWTALPGEPAPLDDSEVDDWLPRFVVLQGPCIFLYFVSTDLSPQDSTLLSDVVEVGRMPCHTQEDDDARYHFYIVTRQGLRYECSSASKLQVDAWVATLQDECKLGSDSTTLDHLSDTSK